MISSNVLILAIYTFCISSMYHDKIELEDGEVSFDRYLRYEEIQAYLKKLNSTRKDLVEVTHYGLSVENRYLTYIKISKSYYSNNPLIFIDGGIHAREWISPTQALYIIYQLIENPKNRKLLSNVDWLIVPLVNPDGYEYTHTDDRYWRKNRAKGDYCDGVDLNRNFNIEWSTVGASKNECSENYAGTGPFSEPESLALSDLIMENAKQIKLYISLHSPYQAIVFPWGYTIALTTNFNEMWNIGLHLAKVISYVNSTTYRVGQFATAIYLSSGTSMDWAFSTANIRLAFTIELKGSDHDLILQRFVIQPKNILSVVDEMFEGFKIFPYHLLKYPFAKYKRSSLP